MLSGLRDRADFVVDTTGLSAAGLRERLLTLFSGTESGEVFEVIGSRSASSTAFRLRATLCSMCVSYPTLLRNEPARAQRHRSGGARLCVPRRYGGCADALPDGHDRLSAAALYRGRQGESDHQHRLHRRQAPLGCYHRGAERTPAQEGIRCRKLCTAITRDKPASFRTGEACCTERREYMSFSTEVKTSCAGIHAARLLHAPRFTAHCSMPRFFRTRRYGCRRRT